MFGGFHKHKVAQSNARHIGIGEFYWRFVWYSCGGFHKHKEPCKVDDARHIGIGEFYSANNSVLCGRLIRVAWWCLSIF